MSDVIYFMVWAPPVIRGLVQFLAGTWLHVFDRGQVAEVWIGTIEEWVSEANTMRRGASLRRRREFPAYVLAIMDGDEGVARAIRERFRSHSCSEISHWYALLAELRVFIAENSRPWDGEESARIGIERPKPDSDLRSDAIGLAGRVKLRRRSV